MALPTSRNTTYAAGVSQVKSVDLNALQDCIIAGKRGPRWRKIHPSAGAVVQGAPGANFNLRWVDGLFRANASGDKLSIPIVLDEGERLLTVRGYVQCGLVDVIAMKTYFANPNALVVTQLGGTQTSAGHADLIETLEVSGLTETCTIANMRTYHVVFEVAPFANAALVWGVAVQTDIL